MSDIAPQETENGRAVANFELGVSLCEERDVKRLRDDINFLWSLLDDIDTAGDIAKADDRLYRSMVEVMQRRRHERVTSDGYSLFVVPTPKFSKELLGLIS